MEESHLPLQSVGIAPIRETSNRGTHGRHKAGGERDIGRPRKILITSRGGDGIEDQGAGPGVHRHVGNSWMGWMT